jgi:hypothetical protein
MSNPTNPFNWQMPTATDLVTDLPADFEVFGQAVATSMADLLGGTTGQILSKNSNTDMDFVWIANDQGDITGITATSPLTGGGTSGAITVGIQSASTSQSGAVQLTDSTSSTSTTTAATPNAVKTSYDLAAAAIPKSTVTTNGDLIYGTGSGTVARLGVGSTGQVLTVSSGVPAWGTASSGSSNVAGKNGVLNSNFSVWQRGTSVSGAGGGAYTADRWFLYAGSNGTVSRQATGDTTNLPFIQYCARVGRLNGVTDTTAFPFSQSFESVNSIPFAGKTVTLSFYARKGANYSPASSGLPVVLATGTGTDQNYSSAGFTGGATPISQTATLTTTWQRFSYSATLSASATQLAVSFNYAPVGTAGANDYFEVTGVQLEIASSASAYSPNAATFQGELAACQRYYEKSYNVDVAPGTSTDNGQVVWAFVGTTITGTMLGYRAFSVIKRGAPTITLYDPVGNINKVRRTATGSANYDNISANVDGSYNNGIFINSASSASATNAMSGHWTASAEL